MAKDVKLSFVISAVDEVTYKVMEISNRVQALTKPFQKVGVAINDLGREAGVGKLIERFGGVTTAIGNVNSAFKDIAKTAAGVGLAAAGVFKYFVHGAYESIDAINDANTRLGISTDLFQGLQFAAAQSGFEIENLNPILTRFHKNIAEAKTGTGETADLFRALGVSAQDLRTKKIDDILITTGSRLAQIRNESDRNAAALMLFGKEGSRLVEVLQDIPKAMQDVKAQGLLIGPEALENTEKFKKGWNTLTFTLSRVRDMIGAELMPVFSKLFGDLLVTISENKGAILDWAKNFAVNLPAYLAAFSSGVKTLTNVVFTIGDAIGSVINFLGPSGVKFAVWGAVIAKLAGPVAMLTQAVWLLGTALLTTPIGWIVLGIAAITAAIMNWDKVMQALMWTWEQVKRPFKAIGEMLGLGPETPATSQATPNATPATPAFPAPLRLGTPALGRPTNIGNAVAASSAAQPVNRSESRVIVDFNNLPRGTEIRTQETQNPVEINRGPSNVFQ